MAIVKPVSFKENEKDLIDYIKDKDFSYYVKNLIRKDIVQNKDKKEEDSANKSASIKKRRNINFEF